MDCFVLLECNFLMKMVATEIVMEVVAEVVAGEGWCGWRVWPAGMAGLVGIRYSVSLPNRTETPQYWQYIYR